MHCIKKTSTIMEYKQFRESAYRHLTVCIQLLDDYGSVKDKRLISEVYYLSGYILEAMISYALCSAKMVKGDCMRSQYFTDDANKFKIHKLKPKWEYAKSKGCNGLKDLIFFSKNHSNNEVQKLFDDWDVKFRYENHPQAKEPIIKEYLQQIKLIYETINKQYTK